MNTLYRLVLRSALLTVITLFGGLLIGLAVGMLAFEMIPGSSLENVNLGHATIAAIPSLLGFLGGGAAWGIGMGRMAGSAETRRMALAGMLGYAPITILLGSVLGIAEPELLAAIGRAGQPVHRVFTMLFVPSAAVIAGVSAAAIGLGLRNHQLAFRWFWQIGLAAGAAFLVVNLVMEGMGWVVGAPGAGQRATMLTVMGLGNIIAALVGGALMGPMLRAPQ
jgi:hypothetical protein